MGEKTSDAFLPDTRPDLVIFDYDETLVSHEPILDLVFSGIFNESVLNAKALREAAESLARSKERNHHAGSAWSDFARGLSKGEGRLTDFSKKDPLLFLKYTQNSREIVKRPDGPPVHPYPGVDDTLKTLRSMDIPAHIVSNATSGYIKASQNKSGLSEYFRSVNARGDREGDKVEAYERISVAFMQHSGIERPVLWIAGDRFEDFPADFEIDKMPGLKKCDIHPVLFSTRGPVDDRHAQFNGERAYIFRNYEVLTARLKSFCPQQTSLA